MVKDRKLVSVAGITAERLSKRHKEENPKLTFPDWVDEYLVMNLEKDEFVKNYIPFLIKKSVDDNSIIIKDEKLNKIVEVMYRNGKLWCDVDDTDCCPHVHFALCLPELAKLRQKD